MDNPNIRFFPRQFVEQFARGANPAENFVLGQLFLHLRQGANGNPKQIRQLSQSAAQSILSRGADKFDQVAVIPAVMTGVNATKPSKKCRMATGHRQP